MKILALYIHLKYGYIVIEAQIRGKGV